MTTTTREITNSDDLIDIRDVIERYEELCVTPDESMDDSVATYEEIATLKNLIEECRGAAGDEQYDGSWFLITLIRDDYFTEYARELAEDIGAVQPDMSWPYTCIDWEEAASELQVDYTSVDFDSVTYWTR